MYVDKHICTQFGCEVGHLNAYIHLWTSQDSSEHL
jgi:hypothetical protein